MGHMNYHSLDNIVSAFLKVNIYQKHDNNITQHDIYQKQHVMVNITELQEFYIYIILT